MPKSDFVSVPSSCTLCPRRCGADRAAGRTGFCGAGGTLKAARAALHYWEEPCISGTKGSGTVFFSGCTLKCCFCQNYPISAEGLGGTAVVEIIYNWPGMGNMAVKAISCRDYPLVQGYVLWIAILYMCINLLVDLSYTYLDPRLKEDR